MEQKLQATSELVDFLKAKIKESIDSPKHYTLETSPAMKKIEQWAKANPGLAAQADKELAEELKGYCANQNSSQS